MGKHNGKARSAGGTKVGAALTRRHKMSPPAWQQSGLCSQGGATGGSFQGRHTTDMGTGMQSILERNDLDELMALAELADRDFTAERYQPIVVGTSAHSALAAEQSAAARAETESRSAHKLHIPRRPPWDASTSAEQLDAQEKASFLNWRRQLAVLEEEEGLYLTPFERNLEVWRQLWRVLERSDIVVQVVDARDPLLYFSEDLTGYALMLHPTKTSFVLLNKSDLLPEAVRATWADYFDSKGIKYGFWSAFVASEAQAKARHDAIAVGLEGPSATEVLRHFSQLLGLPPSGSSNGGSSRTKVLSTEELLGVLEDVAREAVEAADDDDPRKSDPSRRFMVGLVGYPNVGKSSTINAIFGAKKAAVAPTPGKTKHFQTLNVSSTVCLCDCPGLVFPRFAASKAEMVAAGVISIDRLTDVRAPVDVVAARCGQLQLEAVYGLQLRHPVAAIAQSGASQVSTSGSSGVSKTGSAAAVQQQQQLSAGALLLRALARARGWTASSGLPDEVRAGRQILKDYTTGKLLHCKLPPGSEPPGFAPVIAPLPGTVNSMLLQQGWQHHHQQQQQQPVARSTVSGSIAAEQQQQHWQCSNPEQQQQQQAQLAHSTSASDQSGELSDSAVATAAATPAGEASPAGGDAAEEVDSSAAPLVLSEADLELMDGIGIGLKGAKAKRPDHKFHKKVVRSKGSRGVTVDAEGYDGAAMTTGKKGGLVRVGGY